MAQSLPERPQRIPVIPEQVPRFPVDTQLEQGLQYLEDNGYVVFSGVANESELNHGMNLLWNFLEGLPGGIKRDQPETWKSKGWPDPFHSGIVPGQGMSHSEFQWFNRGLPNVSRIFERIWSTKELIVSFDAANATRPRDLIEGYAPKRAWFHLDQNCLRKPGKQCIQGFLNYLPCGKDDGGLVVFPRSHRYASKIFETRPQYQSVEGDYAPLYKDPTFWIEETGDYDKMCKETGCEGPIKICCQPGDFVCWDSREMHANEPPRIPSEPTPSPPTEHSGDHSMKRQLNRVVSYICMTPKSRLYEIPGGVERRQKAFENGQGTSHWPEDCYGDEVRGRGDSSAPSSLALSQHQKSLIPL